MAGTIWVEQLYTTSNDVQMKHEENFSLRGFLFATHMRGLGVMFSLSGAACAVKLWLKG
jgi:hypothetical protein